MSAGPYFSLRDSAAKNHPEKVEAVRSHLFWKSQAWISGFSGAGASLVQMRLAVEGRSPLRNCDAAISFGVY